MSRKATGLGEGGEFKVTRERWADRSIYFGANVHISKVFEREKLAGKIIGLSEYKYLILEIPLVIGHRARYAPGTTVVAKFAGEGTVYGFYSEVLQLQYDPAPIMYLKYPNEVESFEFRASKRFVCKTPARLLFGSEQLLCLINDISAGGCNLTANRTGYRGHHGIEPESEARLQLNLYGLGELELACRVRSVAQSGNSLSCGVQFELEGEAYEQLTKYLEILSE